MVKCKVKVKSIKHGMVVGSAVPKRDPNDLGNVGRFTEVTMAKNGHVINPGDGPDLQNLGCEIKSRDQDAVSAQTIATMTLDRVKETPYESSNVCEKFQQQYRVKYDNTAGIITEAKVYDMSYTKIQDQVKLGYESGRAKIANGCTDKYICGNAGVGYFEKKSKRSKSYGFRIPNSAMEKFEQEATSDHNTKFDQLFDRPPPTIFTNPMPVSVGPKTKRPKRTVISAPGAALFS